MTARALKPVVIRPARVVTPQCVVEVSTAGHDAEWRQRWYGKRHPDKDPMRCQHESAVEIALDRWLSGKLREA